MYISPITIRYFMYDTSNDITRYIFTPKIDYRLEMVKRVQFQWILEQREAAKKWLAQHLSIDGKGADLV